MKSIFKGIEDFFKYFNFLKELVKRDYKKKYYKSVLGVLWSVLNPILMMCVITVVFSTIFQKNIVNFPVYYFIGNIMFTFYSISTSQSLNVILANSALVKKIYMPKYMLVLSTVTVNFITLLFALIPLLGMMIITKVPFTIYALIFPLALVYLVCFVTGFSLILASYGTMFRDLKHLFSIFNLILMYLTPIFYPISRISKDIVFLWEVNPMYNFITVARCALLDGVLPASRTLILSTIYAVAALIVGINVFNKKSDSFILHI